MIEPTVLKHIALRSLSCESGGSFVISDNLVGSGEVVCFNFTVHDAAARGFRRSYSLSFVTTPNSSIGSSGLLTVILPRLKTIADELKNKVDLISKDQEVKKQAFLYLHVRFTQLLLSS